MTRRRLTDEIESEKKDVVTSFSLTVSLRRRLILASKEEDVSRSALVRWALIEYLKARPRRRGP